MPKIHYSKQKFLKNFGQLSFLKFLPRVQNKHQNLTIKRNQQQNHLAEAQIIINP